MDTANSKQSDLDKRYIRMASIWSENSYCQCQSKHTDT